MSVKVEKRLDLFSLFTSLFGSVPQVTFPPCSLLSLQTLLFLESCSDFS